MDLLDDGPAKGSLEMDDGTSVGGVDAVDELDDDDFEIDIGLLVLLPEADETFFIEAEEGMMVVADDAHRPIEAMIECSRWYYGEIKDNAVVELMTTKACAIVTRPPRRPSSFNRRIGSGPPHSCWLFLRDLTLQHLSRG